jgi:DNA-binding NarL/FixJ family response regulator
MEDPSGPLRLGGLAVGVWGRHELYVMSLAALLADRGADVRVLDDPGRALFDPQVAGIRILLAESPLASELRDLAAGRLPVIVLTERAGENEAAEARTLGIHALLPKNASLAELLVAMRSALVERTERASPLTERQRQVLRLLADGFDNAQIASSLGISRRTARAHVSSVLERLGAENRTQAAVIAVRRGYVA